VSTRRDLPDDAKPGDYYWARYAVLEYGRTVRKWFIVRVVEIDLGWGISQGVTDSGCSDIHQTVWLDFGARIEYPPDDDIPADAQGE